MQIGMYQIVVATLAFVVVMCVGGTILLARAARQRALRARLHGGASAGVMTGPAATLAGTLAQVGRALGTDQAPSPLRQRLVQAGYHSLSAPAIYIGAQLLLAVTGVILATPLAFAVQLTLVLRLALAVLVVTAFALLPNIVIGIQQRRRRMEVWQHLPDAIDLLEICVSAGMGLDMAWNSVADELRRVSPALADEMALTNLEMHLGTSRADALRHMAGRTNVDEISSLVATLIQSERFGTSIAQALRVYAEALRTERSQRAEEAAEKLMIKLLVPMVLFIFPVMFIVILGPAALKLIPVFGGTVR